MHFDLYVEKTKTKPQKSSEIKQKKKMESFLFPRPIHLKEDGNCLLAVKKFEGANSVFSLTDEDNGFQFRH